MNVLDRLRGIGKHIKEDKQWRIQEIRRNTSDKEVDLLIRHHSMSIAELSRELGVSNTWGRSLMAKAIEDGELPEVIQSSNNRYMLTLEHAHILAELSKKVKSWSERYKNKNVIVVTSQKGGVGKTQTAIHLSTGLALSVKDRMKTLLVDLDPQGSNRMFAAPDLDADSAVLTAVDLMLGEFEEDSLYSEFRKRGHSHKDIVQNCPLATHIPNLDILPAFPSDERFTEHLISEMAQDNSTYESNITLFNDKVINVLLEKYDTIVIDMPPTNNPLVWSAYEAATFLLIPSVTQELAWASMAEFVDGLPYRLESLPSKGKRLRDFKFVATMYDDEKNHDAEILERMQRELGGDLMNTIVKRSTAFEMAARNFRTVWDLRKSDGLCPPRQLDKAMASIRDLRTEVIRRLILQEKSHEE